MNVIPWLASAGLGILLLTACTSGTNKETALNAEVRQTTSDQNSAEASHEAVSLPHFAVQDINGKTINLQDLKGKKLFINLWASWCPPCRREMPSIEKLAGSTDTNQVAFVMLSLDDNFEKAKRFIKNQKLTLPIYYPAENLPALFNTDGIPVTFIFNEKGELIQRIDGGDNYDTDVYRTLLK